MPQVAAKQGNASSVEGRLARIRFARDGFMIGALHDGTTIKGSMLTPQVGMSYSLAGKWEFHPKFGKQFAFSQWKTSQPKEKNAVIVYLINNCSIIRFAAFPVGAAIAILCPLNASSIRLIVYVFPVPGAPVISIIFDCIATAIASI